MTTVLSNKLRDAILCTQPYQRFLILCTCIIATPVSAEIDTDIGVTAVYQAVDRDEIDAEWTLSADLVIRSTTEKGQWLFYAEGSSVPGAGGVSATYPTANADAGSVLNRDGDGGIQISELNYTFFFRNKKTLSVGLIDLSARLDEGSIANDENTEFLNGSFVHNATIEFPDYTLGAALHWTDRISGPDLTVVIGGSDGIADLPDRSYQNLLSLTSSERGVFVGAEAVWAKERTDFRVGGWWRSDDHIILGGGGAEADDNYGSYAVAGWHHGNDAVTFRLGFAKADVSVANRFAGLSYQRQTTVGLLGMGIAKTVIANAFRSRELSDVTAAELFFRFPIAEGKGHITPSLQHVQNPGFDGSGVALPSSATVASVRIHWAF